MDKDKGKLFNDNEPLKEGDEKMEMRSQSAYKTLDFSKLKFADKCLTTAESLSDIVPIDWAEKESEDVRGLSILEDKKKRID